MESVKLTRIKENNHKKGGKAYVRSDSDREYILCSKALVCLRAISEAIKTFSGPLQLGLHVTGQHFAGGLILFKGAFALLQGLCALLFISYLYF